MRLNAVHVPRSLRPLISSSAPKPGDNAIAPPRPATFYGLVGVQAVSAVILVLSSMSGFAASLGDSPIESFEVFAGIAGLIVATALFLLTRWARPAALIWVCAVMALQLGVYATGDTPRYIVMLLCVTEVALLNVMAVRRLLGVQPQQPS